MEIQINKEKTFFGITLLLGLLTLQGYYQQAITPMPKLEIQIDSHLGKKFAIPNLDTLSISKDDNTSFREPFYRLNQKRKLPPATLALPPIEINYDLLFPPIPAPQSSFWSKFIRTKSEDSLPKISLENLNRIEETKTVKQANRKLSTAAKRLKSFVREQDILKLRNNKTVEGKIISSDNEQYVIHVEKPYSKIFSLPRKIVSKIQGAISLRQVCVRELRNIAAKDKQKLPLLAKVYAELEMEDLAKRCWDILLEQEPNSPEAYTESIAYYLERANIERAYEICQMAKAAKVESDALKLWQAKVEIVAGLPSLALQTIQNAQTEDALIWKINTLVRLNKTIEADKVFAELETQTPSLSPSLLYLKAFLAIKKGDLALAKQVLSELSDGVSRVSKAEVKNLQGVVAYLEGDFVAAIEAWQEAAKEKWEAWYNLSLVCLTNEEYDTALSILNKIRYKSDLLEFQGEMNAAIAYATYMQNPVNNYETSKETLQKAYDTKNNLLFANLIQALVEGDYARSNEQDLELTAEMYQRCLELDFHFSYALLQQVLLHLENKEVLAAKHLLEELQQRKESFRQGQQGDIYALLGLVETILGKEDKGLDLLKQSLAVYSDGKLARHILAWSYNKDGQATKALYHLKKVLDQGDDYTQKAYDAIKKNENRTIWEDSFNRADSEFVRRRWFEEEREGVNLQVVNNQVRFYGEQINSQKITSLTREVGWDNFVSLDANITAQDSAPFWGGIILRESRKEFEVVFGKGSNGDIVYASREVEEEPLSWLKMTEDDIPVVWSGETNRLRIQKSENDSKILELYFNDTKRGEVQIAADDQKFQIGFFGLAESGTEWEMFVDDVTLIETE